MSSDVYSQSRVGDLYAGTIPLAIMAWIFVALRFYSRYLSSAKFWWDDWTILLAVFLDTGLATCYWFQISYGGAGRHTVAYGGPVTVPEFFFFNKIFLAIEMFYFCSAISIKTSLILLYYRIFGVVRAFRIALAVAWSIVIVFFVVCVLVAIFECHPVQFLWDKSIPGGTCINQTAFYTWNGVANLLIDFMILTLTVPMIWRLQLDTRQKWSLSGIFLLGTFACVASIVRVIVFDQVVEPDVTYTLNPASIWTTVEQSMGVICACLPPCRPLFSKLSTRIRSQIHSSKGGTTSKGDGSDGNRDGAADNSVGLKFMNGGRPTKRPTADFSNAGFMSLDEEEGVGGSVTTNVGSSGRAGKAEDLDVMPDAVVKNQSIE